MPESIKLLGSIKSRTKDKTGESIPRLKITEVVLVHCNIASNDCQRNSRVLQTFFPNKLFCQLLDISLKKFLSLKTSSQNCPILKYGFLVKILNR